jgi:hypothetical protein
MLRGVFLAIIIFQFSLFTSFFDKLYVILFRFVAGSYDVRTINARLHAIGMRPFAHCCKQQVTKIRFWRYPMKFEGGGEEMLYG